MVEGLFDNIQNSETAIFCGAGISSNSGLPVVSSLLGKILRVMGIDQPEAEIILQSNMPFEYFMETVMHEVGVEDILDIYNNGEPNSTHHYIAALVANGKVKTIMTTNFDQLIEKALVAQGIDHKVFFDEDSFSTIDWTSSEIKLIKIHGCASDKKKLGITMKAVANKAMCTGKNAAVNSFFSNSVNPDVLVMGYSCSDLFDISPLIEKISSGTGSNICFIDHSQNGGSSTEPVGRKSYKNPFRNFEGIRCYTNTDAFVKNNSEKLPQYIYSLTASSTNWEVQVDRWLISAIEENSTGVVHQLPARLFYNMGEFKASKKHFEASMIMAHSAGNQIMFYSEMGNLAMTLNALGDYKAAKKLLQESIIACRDLGNVNGEITQLQALGNVCRNLSNFDEAITAYDRAIVLCERERDIISLCNSLGNAASAYNHTGRPDTAIRYLDQGLQIAIAIGDKQSEGSMLCSYGLAYAHKGEKYKAAEFIQKSIDITKMLGDRQGECMALHNMSNIHLGFNNYIACRDAAMAALEIAVAINSTPNISRAQYNLGCSYLYTPNGAETALEFFKKALENNLKVFGDDSPEHYPIVKGIIIAERQLGKIQ